MHFLVAEDGRSHRQPGNLRPLVASDSEVFFIKPLLCTGQGSREAAAPVLFFLPHTVTQREEKEQEAERLGNVMAQPRRQPRRGGAALRHLAVPLALLLLPLCLAHLRAAAAAAAASPGWEQGAAAAPEKDAGQEARWRLTEEAPAVTERVGMEIIEDYPYVGPNNRHNPHP